MSAWIILYFSIKTWELTISSSHLKVIAISNLISYDFEMYLLIAKQFKVRLSEFVFAVGVGYGAIYKFVNPPVQALTRSERKNGGTG